MINALVSGTLFNAPTRRTSQNGNVYVMAQVKTPETDDTGLVSVIAFDADVCEALMALSKGDATIVSGPCKPTSWTDKRSGEPRLGLNVIAKVIMTQYSAAKKRKAAVDTSEFATRSQPSFRSCSERGVYTDFSEMEVEHV